MTGWASGTLDATVTRNGRQERNQGLFLRPVPSPGFRSLRLNFFSDCPSDANGHYVVHLPPARYFALLRGGGQPDVPLGEITIESGVTTRIDFVVDLVEMRFRVVEADGSAPARGQLTLLHEGHLAGGQTDDGGHVLGPSLLRGEVFQATFRFPDGTTAFGQPGYGSAIDLGAVRVTGDAAPVTLRLPAR